MTDPSLMPPPKMNDPYPTAYREDMDVFFAKNSEPSFVLQPRCHPHRPIAGSYNKDEGAVTLHCTKCFMPVFKFQVASRYADACAMLMIEATQQDAREKAEAAQAIEAAADASDAEHNAQANIQEEQKS